MSKASELLLDLTIRSALSRIAKKVKYAGNTSSSESFLQKEIGANGADMRSLAKLCREEGWDARRSHFWADLEYQDFYEESYDRNLRVDVKHLTPMIIYECLVRGSKLHYQGWIVTVGGSREVTDDYGQPAWESRIWLTVPGADRAEEYSGANRSTARELYTRIAGSQFEGVDTLGIEEPHPAEGHDLHYLKDLLEEEGSLPLIVSQEQGPLWEAFRQLSVEDPASCAALFDTYGRYRNQETGFWASRSCERYDEKSGSWYRWRDSVPDASSVAREAVGHSDEVGQAFSHCGYTCSADHLHAHALDERLKLAKTDRLAWLSSFDRNGRFLDAQSGFWESLNGEFYSHTEQQWLPAYDEEES